MVNLSWLKIVPYLAVAGVIWWALDSEYTRGAEFEKAKCELDSAKKDLADAIELEKLQKQFNEERDTHERRTTQIIGAYADEIKKLNDDLTDAADHRLYITAKAKNCPANRETSASGNKDTGPPSAEIRFEIPRALEREIRRDYGDAEELEIDRNALIELVGTRPDCFEVVR